MAHVGGGVFSAFRRYTATPVEALAREQRAGDRSEGDRTFRVRGGYVTLLGALGAGVMVRANSVVEAVQWKHGAARVRVAAYDAVRARGVVGAAALGVLQAGT